MHVTTILGQEVGVQYQGVQDKTNVQNYGNQSNLLMIVAGVPRGLTDKVMTITGENMVAKLGQQKDNLYLQAVGDTLNTGVPSLMVLRVAEP